MTRVDTGYSVRSPSADPVALAHQRLGPLDYWPLGERSGLAARSLIADGRDGLYVASPTLGVPGIPGSVKTAVQFGPTEPGDYMHVANDDGRYAFPGVAPFTVSIWARPATLAPASNSGIVGVMGVGGGKAQGWRIYQPAGTGEIWLQRFVDDASVNVLLGTAANTTDWHHFVGVYDGTGIAGFFDGTKDGPFADARSQAHDIISSYLNVANGAFTSEWAGDIGHVAVWDRALTDTEVASVYDIGSAAYDGTLTVRAGTLGADDTIGERSTLDLTVVDLDRKWRFERGDEIEVVNPDTTLAFGGYVDTVTERVIVGVTGRAKAHDLRVVDRTYLADKRIVAAAYQNVTAGTIVTSLWDGWLADEGVVLSGDFGIDGGDAQGGAALSLNGGNASG